MLTEIRRNILQVLYEQRYASPYTVDRGELGEQMGQSVQQILPDIEYLEEKGYLIAELSKVRSRTFYLLRITAKGIELVESDFQAPFRKIEVFISSPSDVRHERSIVKHVLDLCNRLPSIADHYYLRPVDYVDNAPALMGKPPQSIVDDYMAKASDSDLFICILWHRMGTPLVQEATGERFESGTQYEFVDAYHHNQISGRPYMLLYRCTKPIPPDADPEQVRAVEAFFRRFVGERAQYMGLYKTFDDDAMFEETLLHDIDSLLSKEATIEKPSGN